MDNIRVKSKDAARELNMDVLTLRELMKKDRLPIGYAVKKDSSSKYHFYIYRGLLDRFKQELGITNQ